MHAEVASWHSYKLGPVWFKYFMVISGFVLLISLYMIIYSIKSNVVSCDNGNLGKYLTVPYSSNILFRLSTQVLVVGLWKCVQTGICIKVYMGTHIMFAKPLKIYGIGNCNVHQCVNCHVYSPVWLLKNCKITWHCKMFISRMYNVDLN